MKKSLDISIELYRIFCTVAKTGSMSQAAKALYISQPAVSMAIKQLEDKLGGSLFVRNPRGVSLTREGKVFYEYLDRALAIIDTAEEKYMEMAQLKKGEIYISAGDTLSGQFLLPYLEKFNNQFHDINIKVSNRTTEETLRLIQSGQVDLGFINLPIEGSETLEIKDCAEIHDCLICGTGYRELIDGGIKLPDLKNYPVLSLEKGTNTRKYLDEYAKRQGEVIAPIIELASSELLVKFARINLGLAFGVREFLTEDIDNQSLFEITLTPAIPKRSIGMVRLKNVPVSYAAKKFMSLFT